MRLINAPLFLVCMFVIIITTFSQCATGKQFETNLPFELGDVYYQEWVTGIEGGDSEINIIIPIISNPKKIRLDSIYFQGKQAKLEYKNNSVYMGRFEYETNRKTDIIMSNEPYAEYGNKVPLIHRNSRFQLKENVCIVSYITPNKVKYFKIEHINKKEALEFMGTLPKNQ